jgi:hypothetical protein
MGRSGEQPGGIGVEGLSRAVAVLQTRASAGIRDVESDWEGRRWARARRNKAKGRRDKMGGARTVHMTRR